MIAVSQAVTEIQERKKKVIRRLVKFKRLFWDIENQEYALETTATEVRNADLVSISPVRESLDRKGVNIFESGNVTIELENKDNKWNKNNPDGLLAPDSTARLGYRIKLMEMTVDLFYELADGTESAAIPSFTGRVLRPEFNPDDDTVVFIVESRSILLKLANAENVSDIHTNQLLIGAIDGINDTYTSPDTGVGIVDAVRVSGVPQRLGADVKVSNLGDPDAGATFVFTTPPPVASDPRADYKTWKADNPIETLVELLADEANIATLERDIQPVTFPNQVLNKEIFTTQVDWETGTFSDIESTTQPGDILLEGLNSSGKIDDFSDGNFSNNPTWTPAGGGWSISSNRLLYAGTALNNIITTPFSGGAVGTWEISVAKQSTIAINAFYGFIFNSATNSGQGYAVSYQSGLLRLWRINGALQSGTILLSFSVINNASPHTIRVTRTGASLFSLYFDGVLKGTTTDATYSTATFIGMVVQTNGALQGASFDDIFFIDNVLSGTKNYPTPGTWITPVIDTGAGNPIAYGLLDHIDVTPAGTTILYETATSADGFTFPDGFVAITAGGLINSVVRRFIKVRITLTTDVTQTATPTVNEIAINFTTSTTAIVLANFLDLNVFQAIGELAKIANFEWGFSRSGRLFFRERAFSVSPVLTIELKNLKDFTKITDGDERVKNSIRAAYGAHVKITTPETRNDSRPNSFDDHGFKPLNVGSTKLLLDPDADIATGLSIGYFEEFKNAREGLELSIDMRPQLELGDTVRLLIRDAVPSPPWHIGDSSRAIGDKDIHLYGEEQQAAYEVLARILALRNNSTKKVTGLELERVA